MPSDTPSQQPGLLKIDLGGQTIAVSIEPGQTILAAAEQAGVILAAICRRGTCGTCIVKLQAGRVDMPDECRGLSKRDRDRGFILACQAVPAAPEIWVTYDN